MTVSWGDEQGTCLPLGGFNVWSLGVDAWPPPQGPTRCPTLLPYLLRSILYAPYGMECYGVERTGAAVWCYA